MDNRKLRKIIREEVNSLLDEEATETLTADYYLQKFVEKVKNMYLVKVKEELPRSAGFELQRNYNGRGNAKYASVEFIAYHRSDFEYEIELTVIIIGDEIELELKYEGPDMQTQNFEDFETRKRTFGFDENAKQYINDMVTLTKNVLQYR